MTELWPRHISPGLILPFGIQFHLTFVWIAIVFHSFANESLCHPHSPRDRYTQWPFSFQHEVDAQQMGHTHKIFRFYPLFSLAAYEKYTSTVSVFTVTLHHISNE